MANHFIAIAGYYQGGTRIAWHYASEEKLSSNKIRQFLKDSKQELGNVDFGIHKLATNSVEWESVVRKDSFFADVYPIVDYDDFLELLQQDQSISATDIAKVLISYFALSNLKLQKLIYLVYVDYLLKTGKKLFPEQIEAWKHGPVVPEVYELYKNNGAKRINLDKGSKFALQEKNINPMLAKLVSQTDSKNIMDSILNVLKKYATKSASELVDITHRPGTPWSRVYKPEELHIPIKDDVIKKAYSQESFDL